jgi:modulator of FtsH protease
MSYSGFGYGFDQTRLSAADRGALLGKVMGLVAFAFLFTAGGAFVGVGLGPGAFILSILGTFVCLIALMFLRERSPINLILLYAFATFEGMLLGPILDAYIARGMSGVVLDAAGGTALVTLLAGAYGVTTKRDLSGLGNLLFVGLIGLILASIAGLFLHLSGLALIVSAVAVALFSGYVVYDFNRVANAPRATEGDAILFAVSIYIDMFNIFINLLNILGILNSRDD